MSRARLARLLLEQASKGARCAPLAEAAGRLRAHPEAVAEAASTLRGVALEGDVVCVSDPVELALHLAAMGARESEIARYLDWRMFEDFAARALEEAGFQVYRGLALHGKGGFQVDVLGVDPASSLAVAVECKHWSPRTSAPSRIAQAAKTHLERVRRLAAAWNRLGLPRPRRGRLRILPVLLVLREQGLPRVAAGVPVVPASRLRGFLEELHVIVEDPVIAVVEAAED